MTSAQVKACAYVEWRLKGKYSCESETVLFGQMLCMYTHMHTPIIMAARLLLQP